MHGGRTHHESGETTQVQQQFGGRVGQLENDRTLVDDVDRYYFGLLRGGWTGLRLHSFQVRFNGVGIERCAVVEDDSFL